MKNLGCKRGFVVHGMDGMDEITLTTETRMAEVTPQGVVMMTLRPEDLSFVRCDITQLRGGDALGNAAIVRKVLSGERGAKRDIVLLNAAYALLAAGKAGDPTKGVVMAAEAIDSGRATEQLEKLVKMTNK
jgi:anthranilate phosphoribosyltransferase